MTNPFTALPPKARAILYLVFAVIGLGLGAADLSYLTLGVAYPAWLLVALKVVPFVGAGLGLTAASNTDIRPGVEGQVLSREVVAEEYDPDQLPSDKPRDGVALEDFPG